MLTWRLVVSKLQVVAALASEGTANVAAAAAAARVKRWFMGVLLWGGVRARVRRRGRIVVWRRSPARPSRQAVTVATQHLLRSMRPHRGTPPIASPILRAGSSGRGRQGTCELGARTDVELPVAAGEVYFDRLLGQKQRLGDVAVRAALGREPRDPELAGGEPAVGLVSGGGGARAGRHGLVVRASGPWPPPPLSRGLGRGAGPPGGRPAP